MVSRLRRILSQVTIEPVMLLYAANASVVSPVYSQMMEQKICLQIDNYSPDVCANLSAHKHESDVVRGQWAIWGAYMTMVWALPSMAFSLFIGPWSDRFGRKSMMLSAPICDALFGLLLIANVVWPALPLWSLLLAVFLYSFSGGFLGIFTAAMAYVADVSDKGASRTVHIAILETGMAFGIGVGQVVAAFLYDCYGFLGVYLLYTSMSVLIIAYIVLLVRETRQVDPETTRATKIRALVDTDSIRRIWRTLTQERERGRHRVIWWWLAAFFTYQLFSCMGGSEDIMSYIIFFVSVFVATKTVFNTEKVSPHYKSSSGPTLNGLTQTGAYIGLPYLEFKPFNWTLSYYMYYNAVLLMYYTFFLCVIFPFIKMRLHVSDGALLLLSQYDNIVTEALYFIAKSSVYIYVADVLAAFDVTTITQRSLLSQTVGEDEQGCIFAVVSIVEKVTPTLAGYAFAQLFAQTESWMPSFIFGVGTILLIVPLGMYHYASLVDRGTGGSRDTDAFDESPSAVA